MDGQSWDRAERARARPEKKNAKNVPDFQYFFLIGLIFLKVEHWIFANKKDLCQTHETQKNETKPTNHKIEQTKTPHTKKTQQQTKKKQHKKKTKKNQKKKKKIWFIQ